MAQPVVVEDLLHLPQALRLEHVLQVGVPDPEPAEPDLARLGAAVGPVEEAPLPPDVHLDRPGDRPVEPDQLDVVAHALPRPIRGADDLGVGTGETVARISVCTWRSTTGFAEPPPSSPQTSVTSVPGSLWSMSTIASDSIELSLEL